MKSWRPQLYKQIGMARSIPEETIDNAVFYGLSIKDKNSELPVLFTLGHLAKVCGVSSRKLRFWVSRFECEKSYRVFGIRKKGKGSGRLRYICVPNDELKKVQGFINSEILSRLRPHFASAAYVKGNSIVDTAQIHCGARWLVKLDGQGFFDSISERQVYRVFRGIGYPDLLSFEMARICTRVIPIYARGDFDKWSVKRRSQGSIRDYDQVMLGSLPQGAPTSPALANLASYQLDDEMFNMASGMGFKYTRYSDDLAFSTVGEVSRENIRQLISAAYGILIRNNLKPNEAKTVVAPPGTRKIVLGLLVDGANPKLLKEFKGRIRQHIYFCLKSEVGPVRHASIRGFDSIMGFKNHLLGLINYAIQVEPDFGGKVKADFLEIDWPV